jgi:hypothetical protein
MALVFGRPSRKSAKGSPLNEPLKVNDPRAFCWEIESII